MLVGFCRRGNLYSPRYDPIVPPLREHLREAEAEGVPIIFLVDTHAPDDPEFGVFPPHCVEGSGEDEVVPELREFADRGHGGAQAHVLRVPRAPSSTRCSSGSRRR